MRKSMSAERSTSSKDFKNLKKSVSNARTFARKASKLKIRKYGIKKKQCIRFIPSAKSDDVCKCGYIREHHDASIAEPNEKESVAHELCMQELPTDAMGEIKFKGSLRRATVMFVRASDETPIKSLYSYIKETWQMETPRLLISVTGGAKSFKLQPKLKDLFAKGLLKVALTPGAWVITGGTNTGVMKHVGEALEGASNSCIGIATWGIVVNRLLQLIDENNMEGNYYGYTVSSSLSNTHGAFLDTNHSHFILVDDGTNNKYGKEIQLRSEFEKYIMTKATRKNGIVPSVILVLEGGSGTLGTVNADLTGEPSVPVVVIKDSGRAADFLAEALDIMAGKDIDDRDLCDELRNMIRRVFPELKTEEERQTAFVQVMNCVKKRSARIRRACLTIRSMF